MRGQSSSGVFNPMLSMTSLASSRTGRECSPAPSPNSRYHGDSPAQRRFSSRHVPTCAEELAVRTEVMTASASQQFNGLMKYLKKNSEWEERQKQVMNSDMEAFIPEDYDETLRADYERRCSIGERLNTELMTSSKWMKVLRDINAINDNFRKRGEVKCGDGLISQADADIIYRKVLCNCDYGGKKLTYDLFCKALYLAAQMVRPDLEGEAALQEMVSRVVAAAPPDILEPPKEPDHSLDPNVLLVLDHFKPALHDLFDTFCSWNLSNMAEAARGTGAVRMAERTVQRHSTGGLGSTCASSLSTSARRSAHHNAFGGLDFGSPESGGRRGRSAAEADAGGGSPERGGSPLTHFDQSTASPPSARHGEFMATLPPLREVNGCQTPSRGRSPSLGRQSPNATMRSRYGSTSPRAQDPYVYCNGAPVVWDRQRVISLEQFMSLATQLKIMPDLLSRLEVTTIFKRVQTPGMSQSRGGSAYGHISVDAFVDAVGQLAYKSYSKEPYCDEFPEAPERIQGFLLRFLPRSSRVLHEKFTGRMAAMPGASERVTISPSKVPCRTRDLGSFGF